MSVTGYAETARADVAPQFLALDRLAQAQGTTQALLDELLEKLGPVLNGGGPSETMPPDSIPRPVETAVHGAATSAETINTRLQSILNRIDL